MTKFNGHRSWNAWNVSLWINNEERLYRLAQTCIRTCHGRARYEGKKPRRMAAEMFLNQLPSRETPDGAPYTVTTVIEAMRGME